MLVIVVWLGENEEVLNEKNFVLICKNWNSTL